MAFKISLPKITYKGAAIGTNSITAAVKSAEKVVGKPAEKAAAVGVAGFATAMGVPMTPQMVNQAATALKTATYAKPTPPAAAASPVAGVVAQVKALNWKLIGGGALVLLGGWYLLKKA